MQIAAEKPITLRQARVPFLQYPSAKRDDLGRRTCLVFFVPGNPGLVGYYAPFLSTLRQLLDDKESTQACRYAFHVYGRNLLGFDDEDHEPAFGTATAAGTSTDPLTLEEQIRCVCDQIQEVSQSALPALAVTAEGKGSRVFDEVVLIGYSVGAYIALEVFHRHHQARRDGSSPLGGVPLKAGILLFPTVAHIARSSSGQKLELIRRTPWLDRSAHRIAKGFVDLWPRWILDAVLRRLMGFPEHAALSTLRFLASRDGIWQALHMAKDEMRTITEERWSDDLWEIQEAEEDEAAALGGAKFFFYFARADHWVSDECRDEFIERRRKHEKGRTRIVIDEDNIPHAFCIHHSEPVAEKVRLWIEDIMRL